MEHLLGAVSPTPAETLLAAKRLAWLAAVVFLGLNGHRVELDDSGCQGNLGVAGRPLTRESRAASCLPTQQVERLAANVGGDLARQSGRVVQL